MRVRLAVYHHDRLLWAGDVQMQAVPRVGEVVELSQEHPPPVFSDSEHGTRVYGTYEVKRVGYSYAPHLREWRAGLGLYLAHGLREYVE